MISRVQIPAADFAAASRLYRKSKMLTNPLIIEMRVVFQRYFLSCRRCNYPRPGPLSEVEGTDRDIGLSPELSKYMDEQLAFPVKRNMAFDEIKRKRSELKEKGRL